MGSNRSQTKALCVCACENQVIKQSSPASPRGRFHRTGGTPHCFAVKLSLCTRLALVSVMNILSGKKSSQTAKWICVNIMLEKKNELGETVSR